MAINVRRPGEVLKDNKKRGYSIVLYGPPLVGKTTSLANDPDFRVCLIDFDKNSATVEESENVTIIGCDDFQDYLDVKAGVDAGIFRYPGGELVMDFDVYVIDSFTSMEGKIKKHVAGTFAPNRKREIQSKFGAQTDWADLQDIEVQEVRDWQAMTKRNVNPINVMWMGHDMTVNNDMGQAVATQLMLQGKYASPQIGSAVDAMFYMFKQTFADRPGEVFRGIYTLDHSIYKADARMAIDRRHELEPIIWAPKWGEIFETLGYYAGDEN